MELEQWRKKFAGDPDVVSVEMHPTAFRNGTFLEKAVQITMANGTTLAGCTWDGCLEVAKHPTSIVTKHWRGHAGAATPMKARQSAAGYANLTFQELTDALRAADAKLKRAEAARDKALEQVANMRDVNREVITGLREQLQAARDELVQVRQAVKVLYPGALG